MIFAEHDHDHGHDHGGPDVSDPGYQHAHERAHANDIKQRFAGRDLTTGQIILFGLTGGLIPCPAAITVLLLCLQLKQIALGATLVLCFSIGLVITMVTVGVVAALGMRHAEKRFGSAFSTFTRRAPYASGVLITVVGLILAVQAVRLSWLKASPRRHRRARHAICRVYATGRLTPDKLGTTTPATRPSCQVFVDTRVTLQLTAASW